MKVRVAAKSVEAVGICSIELIRADGGVLPSFTAGSHIDVRVGDLNRQYSLCNDPDKGHRYQIAVLRDPNSRGGSQAIHESINVGDVIEISAPKNHFPLAHDARKHLLLAGGIGVTPILCMAQRLSSVGAAFEMHYCARSAERTAFCERIRQSSFADRVRFHFDEGPVAQKFDMDARLADVAPGEHLYVCGPKGFMDAALNIARKNGWPEEQLHCEFFAADLAPKEDDGHFEVELASSGRVIQVTRNQTVLQALAAAGATIPASCEQGVCGTCRTRVLSGEPDHRDLFLTPFEQAANDSFLPCCSRSKSARLVLDL